MRKNIWLNCKGWKYVMVTSWNNFLPIGNFRKVQDILLLATLQIWTDNAFFKYPNKKSFLLFCQAASLENLNLPSVA